jgi:hypothetical protein
MNHNHNNSNDDPNFSVDAFENYKQRLYKKKLNRIFRNEDSLNEQLVIPNSNPLLEHGQSCHNFYHDREKSSDPNLLQRSGVGQSISKRRMKLKGVQFPTEATATNYPDKLRKNSIPSNSVLFDQDQEQNLLTNCSDPNYYINSHIKFAKLAKSKTEKNIEYQKSLKNYTSKPNLGFLNALDECLQYFEQDKINFSPKKRLKVDRLDSVVTMNSVKFHTPENQISVEPYKEFDTITSGHMDMGLLSDEGLLGGGGAYGGMQHMNEVVQQNMKLLEDNKELQEVCSILSNELERQKLGYKKLRGKYKIIKENNQILGKKLENERSSHNESRGF